MCMCFCLLLSPEFTFQVIALKLLGGKYDSQHFFPLILSITESVGIQVKRNDLF